MKSHEHKWVSIRKGYPQKICKCGELKVGTNTVLLGDLVRYSSTKLPAAAGQLGMDLATGRAQQFVGGAVEEIANLSDITGGGSSNAFMFGGGVDGALTLVANAAFAQYEWAHEYTNVILAGFTLTSYVGNPAMLLQISGTLTMGGGTIKSAWPGLSAPGAAGNGQGSPVGQGHGGAGGIGSGSVYVWARTIDVSSGPATISASGGSGAVGVPDLSLNPAGGGSGGNGVSQTVVQNGVLTITSVPAGGNGGPTAQPGSVPGGTGGAGGNCSQDPNNQFGMQRDITSILFPGNGFIIGDLGQRRGWYSTVGAGGGGAGGADVFPGTNAGGGGGGGGGGYSICKPGLTGGSGGQGGPTTSVGQSGGGGGAGGGGGSGALVVVVCGTILGTVANLRVKSIGGNGGSGGDSQFQGAAGGAGGGGGGGCGGRLVYSGPTGPTLDVAAGGQGVGGNQAAAGTGADGTPGTTGLSSAMYT